MSTEPTPRSSDDSSHHPARHPAHHPGLSDVELTGKAVASVPVLAGRSFIGGLLMGIANVVPGISGGAMLLIVGVYHAFIDAIATLTRLKIRLRPLVLVGAIGFGAVLSILLTAGPIKAAVVGYPLIVYSVFIGLRLGAAPIVWKLCRPDATKPVDPKVWIGVAGGIIATALLAVPQYTVSASGGPLIAGVPGFFVAGLVGASATILPGMDGSYFLMLMGKYLPTLGSISRFKDGLIDFGKTGSTAGIVAELPSLIAVGVGVALGLAIVSTLLRWLFKHHQQITAGALLGIVVGAIGGLWPFRQHVMPKVGEVVQGVTVTAENVGTIDKDKWPVEFFAPTFTQVLMAIGLIVLGYVLAKLLSKLDPGEERLEAAQHQ